MIHSCSCQVVDVYVFLQNQTGMLEIGHDCWTCFLQGLLDGHDGSLGIKCDTASRVSRAGALTWWHLDDGGEFVLQVGCPKP
jgi:hypothetical protein